MMVMVYGGPENILNTCSLSVLNTWPTGTRTILEWLVWIWEMSSERLMELILNGETVTPEMIGRELLKYVLKECSKLLHIGSFLSVGLITNLILHKSPINLLSFRFQTSSYTQVIIMHGHGEFALGHLLSTMSMKRKCLILKHSSDQKESHFYWVSSGTIRETFHGNTR